VRDPENRRAEPGGESADGGVVGQHVVGSGDRAAPVGVRSQHADPVFDAFREPAENLADAVLRPDLRVEGGDHPEAIARYRLDDALEDIRGDAETRPRGPGHRDQDDFPIIRDAEFAPVVFAMGSARDKAVEGDVTGDDGVRNGLRAESSEKVQFAFVCEHDPVGVDPAVPHQLLRVEAGDELPVRRCAPGPVLPESAAVRHQEQRPPDVVDAASAAGENDTVGIVAGLFHGEEDLATSPDEFGGVGPVLAAVRHGVDPLRPVIGFDERDEVVEPGERDDVGGEDQHGFADSGRPVFAGPTEYSVVVHRGHPERREA
jgi:hypothetical protein